MTVKNSLMALAASQKTRCPTRHQPASAAKKPLTTASGVYAKAAGLRGGTARDD